MPPRVPVSPELSTILLFGRYKTNQYAIASRVESAIANAWGTMIVPESFNVSWHRLEPLVSGIVDVHYSMSAADAAEYYLSSRAVAGLYGGVIPGVFLSDDYRSTVVNARGAGQFFHYLDKGFSAPEASLKAMDSLVGASVRLVLNGGRKTVTQATAYDRNATGWERIIEDSEPCDYCAAQAGSVGVQKSAQSIFHAHDLCQCLARAVFTGQQSANGPIRDEWNRVTAGMSGKQATSAWNKYWSERNVQSEPQGAGEPAQVGAGNAPVPEEPVG